MHQHTGLGHIIGVVVRDLEIVNLDRAFQQFVLNLLDDHIFAVDEDKDISGTEVYSVRPALGGGIERMTGCANNFLVVYKNMHQFVGFIT